MHHLSITELLKTVFPDFLLHPKTVQNILQLPSFLSTIHYFERISEVSFDTISLETQNQLILTRLKQLIEICRVNPLWKERINQTIGSDFLQNFEAFTNIPITDKETYTDLFSGTRKGMVVPIHNGNFQIANSGGTASGRASEIVFSKKELHDTYSWAGRYIGKHIIARYMDESQTKWVGTTLADSQLWSSGTMVGGLLQEIPNTNYWGIGAMSPKIYQRIMQTPGQKALMGIVKDIASLIPYAKELTEEEKQTLSIALYGSGGLPEKIKKDLKRLYPNLTILSFFAATQAETIGLQLDPNSPILTAVPGLHFIEIVDKNGKWVNENEEGDLIVTRLFANEAPVLRYKLGDRVIRRPDYKSRTLNAIQFEYVGRSDDFITLMDTSFYIPHVLSLLIEKLRNAHLFDFNDIAEEYQFQINPHHTKLSLYIVTSQNEHYNNLYQSQKSQMIEIIIQTLLELQIDKNQFPLSPEILKKHCHFELVFVPPESSLLHRTEVGKTPLIYKTIY